MKRLALVCCLLAAPAYGQPLEEPERVSPESAITIGVGQTETLKFRSSFGTVSVATDGIVQLIPQSDRTLTLYGRAPGTTLLTVRSDRGDEIYSAFVNVSPEPGHVVKLYGRNVPDYVGFYCTDVVCGRADKELGGSREPSRSEQTIIHRGRRDQD